MRELASCVCNYAQVRGCRAVRLGLGFEARKEGKRRGGGGDQESEKKKERSSEARENLVILRTAALLMDTECGFVCVFGGGGGRRGWVSRKGLCLSNLFPAFTMW